MKLFLQKMPNELMKDGMREYRKSRVRKRD